MLAAALPGTVAERVPEVADQLTVITGDALRVDIPSDATVLAANLPYNVAVPLLLRLLHDLPALDHGVVMVQAEVAQRLAAPPGSRVYGVPSAKLAWYAKARVAGSRPAHGVLAATPGRQRLADVRPPGSAARRPEADVRRHRRGLRAAAQDVAGRPRPLGRRGRTQRKRRWPKPGSARALGGGSRRRSLLPHRPSTTLTAMRPGEVTVRAPGKVNLYLAVGALDDDGFHEVRTVLQAVSLYDELTASPAEPGKVALTIEGEGAKTLAADEGNLAVRAARLLAASAEVTDGVQMVLRKSIPVAAGMAGGSADAAAALVACDALWGTDLSRQRTGVAGRRARQRRPVLAGGRHGAGYGTGRDPVAGAVARHLPLGVRHRRWGAVHPCGLRRTRPLPRGAAAPGAVVALRHPRGGAARRSRGTGVDPRERPRSPGAPAASRAAPGARRRDANSAHSLRWSAARDRPAPS